jgi:lipopolysaccharide transport system permease protein
MRKIITSDQESLIVYLKKIWQYRSLILVFAKRDLKVKYAQTWLGLGWTILQPLTGLLIFTFFFGYIMKWQADGIPYSLYVLSGLLGWNFFSYIVYQGSSSIQESSALIKKVYFPKVVLPISKVYVALVELAVSFLLIIPLIIWHQQMLSWKVLFIPIALFFNVIAAFVLVFFTAIMSYRKRDILHIVPFLIYFGIWVTPVFFTKSTLPQHLYFVWYINPMAGVTELWRWCLFPNWDFNILFVPSIFLLLPFLLLGLWLFIKTERKFSDFV